MMLEFSSLFLPTLSSYGHHFIIRPQPQYYVCRCGLLLPTE